jgi:hypothetical protein
MECEPCTFGAKALESIGHVRSYRVDKDVVARPVRFSQLEICFRNSASMKPERNRRGKVRCRDKGVPVFAFDVDSRQAPKGLFAVTLGLGQIAAAAEQVAAHRTRVRSR